MEPPRRITPEQARAARLLLGWTQRGAAEKVSITISSVCEAEHGRFSDITAARLRAAYEAAGVEFTNGDQPGVRFRTLDERIEDVSNRLAKDDVAKSPSLEKCMEMLRRGYAENELRTLKEKRRHRKSSEKP